MDSGVELVGYVAAALTTAAFAPQVWRTWRTGSARDLALAMLTLMISGNGLWMAYGLATGAGPLVAANLLTLLLVAMLAAMKVRSRAPSPMQPA